MATSPSSSLPSLRSRPDRPPKPECKSDKSGLHELDEANLSSPPPSLPDEEKGLDEEKNDADAGAVPGRAREAVPGLLKG